MIGSIMGLTVAAMGLVGSGASIVALFSRVGGIFTKYADVALRAGTRRSIIVYRCSLCIDG